MFTWNASRAPQQIKSAKTGCDKASQATVENNLCQHIINRTRHQFSVGDFSHCTASIVDRITDYNDFYSIFACRSCPV